ncbi:MAG TPA: hybrid sensor histidine kinase/response regulator [Polyangiaceae bacterium]|nr:hybrid sensor histidine kinase/response regulator [Polyangiaceae bacterium]
MTRKHGIRSTRQRSSVEELVPASSRELEQLTRDNEKLSAERRGAELVRDEYLDLYEFAPLPALTLDAGYRVRRLNRAMLALLQTDSNRCLKQSFRSFVLLEDRRSLSTHLAKAGRGALERCRLRLVPREGPPILVEFWTTMLARTGLYQIAVVDLSEQTRGEVEAHRLAESERAARDENAAKDTFIAMLSHELRGPLTPALAAASHFRSVTGGPPEVTKAFAMIHRGILAQTRMIDDLLDVNRVLRGKMSVTCSPASVHDIVCEAVQALREDVVAKGQTLELELAAERDSANIDVVRLRQVFWNLLRNAVKFTGEGGTIRVRSWNQVGRVVVEVEDTGIGIPAADLGRLFKPFDQLESRPGASGGLGLGLTISRGLVELQGGKLSAQSNGRGQGSRFVVELGTVDAPVAKPTPSEARLERPPLSPAEQRRILLVEDDVDTAEIMTEVLEAAGFQVQTAKSAAAAKRVDMALIDLIVSDLGLPDQSGLELISELQAARHRPALALSGFGMEADIAAARVAGFDAHLTKPVDVRLLLSTVRRLALGPT